jgi:hypothetical protein
VKLKTNYRGLTQKIKAKKKKEKNSKKKTNLDKPPKSGIISKTYNL